MVMLGRMTVGEQRSGKGNESRRRGGPVSAAVPATLDERRSVYQKNNETEENNDDGKG